jgi:nucleoside-diphosphate-sugar epimerase
MNCLITGITGYIGSHLAQRLIHHGHHVTGMIHQTQPVYQDDRISYLHGDLTQSSEIKGCTKDMDIVVHCAGLVNDYASTEQLFDVHVKGTKYLVNSCKMHQCKRFIFLSHIPYESRKKTYPYPQSKAQAEEFLINEYRTHVFPVVIVRPGNVYGPKAPTWVIRPIQAIKEHNMALIDRGLGIFHHTYIDNLIDALVKTIETPTIEGKIFEITDGDNSVTWKRYLNDLCNIIGMEPITKNISSQMAKLLGHYMLLRDRVFGIPPLVTPYAVEIFSNKTKVSIDTARDLLGYIPRIDYQDGMKQIEYWLQDQGIDSNV